jgi:hypothetical protein
VTHDTFWFIVPDGADEVRRAVLASDCLSRQRACEHLTFESHAHDFSLQLLNVIINRLRPGCDADEDVARLRPACVADDDVAVGSGDKQQVRRRGSDKDRTTASVGDASDDAASSPSMSPSPSPRTVGDIAFEFRALEAMLLTVVNCIEHDYAGM